jgi:GTP-binding protein
VTRPHSSRDPLPIRSLEFLGGTATAGGWRPEPTLPEIAFSGRSNVGKSSLLNLLVRRKGFARVSNTPGRTREINFFQVNDQFLMVDLPGYGYARASKTIRAAWRPLVEWYLAQSKQLRGVVQLLDIRHEPTADDMQMFAWLAALGTPVLIAATKSDKVSARQLEARVSELAESVGVQQDAIVPVSAQTGLGREELLSAIVDLLGGKDNGEGRSSG